MTGLPAAGHGRRARRLPLRRDVCLDDFGESVMNTQSYFAAALLAATALTHAPAFAGTQAGLSLPALSRHDVTDLGAAPADTLIKMAITLRYRGQVPPNTITS